MGYFTPATRGVRRGPPQSFRLDASHTCPNCGCITARCTAETGRCNDVVDGRPHLRLTGATRRADGRRCWRIMPSTTAHYAVRPRSIPGQDADEFRCEAPSGNARNGMTPSWIWPGLGEVTTRAGVGVGHVAATAHEGLRRWVSTEVRPVPASSAVAPRPSQRRAGRSPPWRSTRRRADSGPRTG